MRRLLYDARLRALLYQVLAVLLVAGTGFYLFQTVSQKLADQNIATGFDYLSRPAGFVISQTPISYKATDTYLRALVVGLLNTILISVLAVILSTVIGFAVGIARLSKNPLLPRVALVYVEMFRNVPLLLQLFFWYALIIGIFPPIREAWTFGSSIFLSNGGLFVPTLKWSPAVGWFLSGLVASAVATIAYVRLMSARRIRTGAQEMIWPRALIMFGLLSLAAFMIARPELALDIPEKGRFRLSGGAQLTPELTALLIGLGLSASAGVAEIVRSGILAIGRDQWEAARALGLRDSTALRLIILPQSLRVIIPPLTSSYLSTFKNSSLAIAIGYPDLVMVSNTTMNQTGQAIEGIAIFMFVYLALSLTISGLLNWQNARIALRERHS